MTQITSRDEDNWDNDFYDPSEDDNSWLCPPGTFSEIDLRLEQVLNAELARIKKVQ